MRLWLRKFFNTARLGWVWTGTAATALIAIGSHTPAYLPQESPWWTVLRSAKLDGTIPKTIGTILVLSGLALLVGCWLSIRRRLEDPDPNAADPTLRLRPWAVLIIWALPLLFAPPTFSHDAYSYAAQGWLAHNGLNPYEVGPGALPGAFADHSSWIWRFTPTPYGPLSIVIQHGLVDLSGANPYIAALLMRIPALVGVGLIVTFLPKIARKINVSESFAAWLGILNPIMLTDFIGGAHNDALMTGLFILGLWLVYRRPCWKNLLIGAAVIGLAGTIKQPALLASYAAAFIGYPVWRITRKTFFPACGRVLASCGTAIASFSLVSFLTCYGFGWLNAVGVPGSVLSLSPPTLLGRLGEYILNYFHIDQGGSIALDVMHTLGTVITVIGIGYLAIATARKDPMKFLAWGFVIFTFCSPALHGWYLMWSAVTLALTKLRERTINIIIWIVIVVQYYAAVNFSCRNGLAALGIASTAFLLWPAIHYLRKKSAAAKAAASPAAENPEGKEKQASEMTIVA